MAISGINQVMSAADQPKTSSKNVMGKDEFLHLLVAQLKHQDPLNPMDSTGFTAQLAQFSSLEQLQNVNNNLSAMGNAQNLMANSQAVDFIGKTITANGDGLNVISGSPDDIRFSLNRDAASVYVNIYDSTGLFVRNLELGVMAAGDQTITWDGLDQGGNIVVDGAYQFEILAMDEMENRIRVDTYTSGTVTGVNYKNGSAYLMAGPLEIPLDQVLRVLSNNDQQSTNSL